MMTTDLSGLHRALQRRLDLVADRAFCDHDAAGHLNALMAASREVDRRTAELPPETDPRLRHYLERQSYVKALEWLNAQTTLPADADDLVPGRIAPDFQALAVGGACGLGGALVRLSDLRGVAVVLYFYPQDDTPGCTAQACGLRDRWSRLQRPDTLFFGVSVDSPDSHRRFIEKYALPFPIFSDEDRVIVRAYGVWVKKGVAGNTFPGTERTTFVIRPDGRIKSVFRRVNPDAHAELLVDDLANFEP